MKALHIGFLPDQVRRPSVLLSGLCVVGCLAIVAGIVLGLILGDRSRARSTQATQLLAQQASLSEAMLRQEEISPAVALSANTAIRKLDYPLIEILTELERHATPEVKVVSAELGPMRSSLRLVVQAASIPRVLDYMDQIKKERDFRNVVLTHQEPGNGGDARSASRFTLEAVQQGAADGPAESGPTGDGAEP